MKAAAGADAGSCPPKKKKTTTPLALVPNRNPLTPHVWHRSSDSDSVAAASRRSSSQTLNIYCCLFLGSEMFPAPNNRCVFLSPGQHQRSAVTRPDVACQRKFSQLKRVKKPSQFRILGGLISLRLNFTCRDNKQMYLSSKPDIFGKSQSFLARRLFGEKARQEVNYVGESGGCFNQSSARVAAVPNPN